MSMDKTLIRKIKELKDYTDQLPSSREKSMVQTKLDEAVLWARAIGDPVNPSTRGIDK